MHTSVLVCWPENKIHYKSWLCARAKEGEEQEHQEQEQQEQVKQEQQEEEGVEQKQEGD